MNVSYCLFTLPDSDSDSDYCTMCHGKSPVSLWLTYLHQYVPITKAIGLSYGAPIPLSYVFGNYS